jgi:hypothetical protein
VKTLRKLILFPLLFALLCVFPTRPAAASAEEYAFRAAGEVVLGCADPAEQTVEVSFLNLYDAGEGGTEFYALDLHFDTADESGMLTLTELRCPAAASYPDENDPATGHVLWTDSSFERGVAAPVEGAIWTAVYTVAADAPAGIYTVSMTGEVVGYHPDREDAFDSDIGLSYTASVTVKTHDVEAVPVGEVTRWRCRECGRFFADERCVVSLPKTPAELFRCISSGETVLPDALEPDVNGDGKVNSRDAMQYFRLWIREAKPE